jgi:hypothetical protein
MVGNNRLTEDDAKPGKVACDELILWLEENGDTASLDEIKAKQKETEDACLPVLNKASGSEGEPVPEPTPVDEVD